ncbi:CCR4-NOT transcription complex subunit 11 isoform X2 [Histomonas meleagridis]|uniref:CCR4-NOT transcription complex subunit 11 isoform X2 n=1 Tax=Histomonas meleagridis TaxID=135588 RepID=UPI003559A9AC|nr:CCR4-NOT transcription complex subunit 11 isoform X2 [Histomonas meleagridis]KAH0797113.1 CCR4-NOT transcription complex subunit 11 isoform X2 [Histomonas meleagridis]
MVSKEIADSVISLISSESVSLANLTKQFKNTCNKIDQLSVLSSLSALLMDVILEPPQQIITAWLLYSSFSDVPIRENPFFDVLQFVLNSSNSYSQKLCDIINCLVNVSDLGDIAEKTVLEILDPNFSIDSSNTSDLLTTTVPQIPRISPVIVSKADPTSTQISQYQLLRELLIDPSLWTDFDVPFCRQMPTISTPSNDELQFMNINSIDGIPFLFDELKAIDNSVVTKFFLEQSNQRSLKPAEITSILDEYKKDKTILQNMFTKEEAQKVLELNPQIGALYFVGLPTKERKIFDTFIKSDISLSTVEAVKTIMMLAPDQNFFSSYISHAIQTFQETKDIHALRNKAKLFCELMIYLHKNKVEFTGRMYLDLHSLRIELEERGVKEAAVLSSLME